ncbi:GNAT family N-acetyltransferase [Longimicrobium sp.]|uniref:GNAT family N-acetyltransferase n=1 Tax=Longimicrobium sp. TaxID=2029185 RepID=UPI002B9206BA|nr:GNAT family N-acetyltransferase [Longimicrobium sp.]HSU16009.1 GNAT family N-acetyltransferase [Longimicrobium sp.]
MRIPTSPSDVAVTIRRASTKDADALAALRWEFRAAITAPNEDRDAFVPRCAEWMRARLGDGDSWRAWVAEVDGEIVGTVWLQMLEKMPNPVDEPEVHGYITNLYVRESARGGVGVRLLAAALDECAAAGVHQAFLWPTQRSRTLYHRAGFEGDGDVMVWARGTPGE